jgi:hypothetical protein
MATTDPLTTLPQPVRIATYPAFADRHAPTVGAAVGILAIWRSDLRFLLTLAVGLLVVSSIPFTWAYASSSPERPFMGLTHTTHDYSQYMAWARDSQTQIFVDNKLTPEPTDATFFNPVWWTVGRVQAFTGLSFAQVNQLLRLVAGLAFVLSLGAFAAVTVPQEQRRLAVLLACLTSGLGWLLVIAKQAIGQLVLPLLVHSFPGNTFFGMMVAPHMILSASMVIGVFFLMLEAYRKTCGRRTILAGLLCAALGFAHPYNIVTVYSVIGAFSVVATLRDGFQVRWFLKVVAFYALSAPSVLYWMWMSAGSESWREVLAQYRNLGVFTPDPAQLTILLGLTLVVAAVTFRGLVPLRDRSIERLFVDVWMVVNLCILYLPLNFQFNLLSGIQVPLAIVAIRGLFESVIPSLRAFLPTRVAPLARFAPIVFILMVLPTNLYLVSWQVLDLSRRSYPEYLDRGDVAALHWLDDATEPADVILSSQAIGGWIPGQTGAHAFLAHGVNTLRYYEKRHLVEQFFAADGDDAVRQQTLQAYGVRYVFHGPAERALGTFDPSTRPYLQPSYTSERTTVYRVVPSMAFANR